MFTLVIGASASGKSEYAEHIVTGLDGRRIYLATMRPFGEDAEFRISRHRGMRKTRGFEAVERYTDLLHLELPQDANVLLEDLGNLVANELFSGDGGGKESVAIGIRSLLKRCRHLTAVTNEVFLDGRDYDEGTVLYLKTLADLNRELAGKADRVVEVVCGNENVLKEEEK